MFPLMQLLPMRTTCSSREGGVYCKWNVSEGILRLKRYISTVNTWNLSLYLSFFFTFKQSYPIFIFCLQTSLKRLVLHLKSTSRFSAFAWITLHLKWTSLSLWGIMTIFSKVMSKSQFRIRKCLFSYDFYTWNCYLIFEIVPFHI